MSDNACNPNIILVGGVETDLVENHVSAQQGGECLSLDVCSPRMLVVWFIRTFSMYNVYVIALRSHESLGKILGHVYVCIRDRLIKGRETHVGFSDDVFEWELKIKWQRN